MQTLFIGSNDQLGLFNSFGESTQGIGEKNQLLLDTGNRGGDVTEGGATRLGESEEVRAEQTALGNLLLAASTKGWKNWAYGGQTSICRYIEAT